MDFMHAPAISSSLGILKFTSATTTAEKWAIVI
jgi:hypothetical protein